MECVWRVWPVWRASQVASAAVGCQQQRGDRHTTLSAARTVGGDRLKGQVTFPSSFERLILNWDINV